MTLALKYYTSVMDFIMPDPLSSVNAPVIDLINEEAFLQIRTLESNQLCGSVANVLVDNVDALFANIKAVALIFLANQTRRWKRPLLTRAGKGARFM